MGTSQALRFLCGFAVAALTLTPTQAGEAYGSVYLNSLPIGADVWVDGSYIGRTPILLDGLRAGKHAVTVTKTGWRVEEVDEHIVAGVTVMSSVQLDPVKATASRGSLTLHGLAAGARVRLDSGTWGPPQSSYILPAGAHRLAVKDRGQLSARTLEIYPDQVTHVLCRASQDEKPSWVGAPLADYLPENSANIDRGRLVIRYGGHVVVGRIGDARFSVDKRDITYDAPAGLVRGKLYLPLDLMLSITGGKPH